MNSAFSFPVTPSPRRKRAASGADSRLYNSFETPIRLRETKITPGSHDVPELDWEPSPDTTVHYPTTPSDKASPSPILKNAGNFSIVPTRPLKQLTKPSLAPATIFSPSSYPVLSSQPSLDSVFKVDISWKNSSFYELSKKPSNTTASQTSPVAQLLYGPRKLAELQRTAEPTWKKFKARGIILEKENKPSTAVKVAAPTEAKLPEAVPQTPAEFINETCIVLTGVTLKRFSRVLPIDCLKRIWEDESRCVASLVAKPDTRCSASVESSKDVKKWICSQVLVNAPDSDIMAWKNYLRELISFTTCTAYHRDIAEKQSDRLFDRYHDRCNRRAGDKHDFTKRDIGMAHVWVAALTTLPMKGSNLSVQPPQHIDLVQASNPLRPLVKDVSPACKKYLPTHEREVVLNDKAILKDSSTQPQTVDVILERSIHSSKASRFEQLLSLLKIDPQQTTCIGTTRRGLSCRLQVAQISRNQALGLLKNVLGRPSPSILEDILSLLLCKRYQQAHAGGIMFRWLQIVTVENGEIFIGDSQHIKTEELYTTAESTEKASQFHSPRIAEVKVIQTRAKTVALRQSHPGAKFVSSLDISLIGCRQNFTWYTPKGSGRSISVENRLHQRLSANLTWQEYKMPSKVTASEKYPGQGLIYLYWIPGSFGFVKIGKTSGESTKRRLGQWQRHCGHLIEEYTRGEKGLAMQLRHACRVEKLVHDELKDFRLKEKCCQGCEKGHFEWFAVPQYHALKVIQKWSDWIMTQPYIETGGVWRLKKPVAVDDDLCKPLELPVGHSTVLPALPGRPQARAKTSRRISKGRRKSS